MGGKYTIVRHDLGDGAIVEVLATCENRDSDFLDRLFTRDRDRFKVIARTIKRISLSDGNAYRGTFLRMIDDGLSLVEIRIPGKVIRVMAYDRKVGNRMRLILLFDFDGHQGKTGNIPRHLIEKGRSLAKNARECAEGEQ